MEITRLSATYRRSVSVTPPDGREAWVAHEVTIEASYEPEELTGVQIPDNIAKLRQIAIKEVADAIRTESEALKQAYAAANGANEEAFPSQDTNLAKMPRV